MHLRAVGPESYAASSSEVLPRSGETPWILLVMTWPYSSRVTMPTPPQMLPATAGKNQAGKLRQGI